MQLVGRHSDSLSDNPPFQVGVGPTDRASAFGVGAAEFGLVPIFETTS